MDAMGLARSPRRRIIDHHGSPKRKGIFEDDLLSCFAPPFSSSLHSTFMLEVEKCHFSWEKLALPLVSELLNEFTLSTWHKVRVGVFRPTYMTLLKLLSARMGECAILVPYHTGTPSSCAPHSQSYKHYRIHG